MSDGNRDADEGAAPTPEREPCPKCAAIHRTCHDSLPWERAPEPCPGLANATGSYHGHCHHRELYETEARMHSEHARNDCRLIEAAQHLHESDLEWIRTCTADGARVEKERDLAWQALAIACEGHDTACVNFAEREALFHAERDAALARIHDLERQLADAIDTSNRHLAAMLAERTR